MAFLWKRKYSSGKMVWVIYYRVGKKQKSKVIGETDKRTAERVFTKFCAQLADKEFGIKEVKKITLNDFQQEYIKFAQKEKALRTIEREIYILRIFIEHFENGNIYLEEIEVKDLKEYRIKRLESVSEETVNLEFRHLKAIFNIAKSLNYLQINPFVRIKPIRVPQSELPKFFELNEIEIVREAFKNDEFESLIEFYLLTGSRLKEPLSLTWNDIDFKRKLLTIRSVHAKGKKHRIVSFAEDEQLEQLLINLNRREDNLLFGPKNGSPQWSHWWVSRKISKKLTAIGLPWASAHTFRHTYISHLVMAGVPLTTVQQLVGHGSITTTLKYAHLAPKHKHEMMGKRPY